MSEPLWRVGRSQPINLYYGGEYVGVVFGSPAIAAAIVERMNEDKPVPAGTGVDWAAVDEALKYVTPSAGDSLRGVIDLLSRKLTEAVGGLEVYMRNVHDNCRVGPSFEECHADLCVAGRAKLADLRGYGE